MPKKKEPTTPAHQLPVPIQIIERRIYFIRGHKVMLDSDLAELYQVQTRALVQAVKRNLERFPTPDFMFQLSEEESEAMRSQFVIASKRNIRYQPYAFTEQGIAMLSSVLRSSQAIQVNITIMRAFVQLRQMLATNEDLARKIDELEQSTNTKLKKHDDQIKAIFEAIKKLIKATTPPISQPPKRKIGFKTDKDDQN
jgi:hypothetical protein